jgi:lipoprotein signal peptidase
VFNVADAALVIGGIVLVVLTLREGAGPGDD